MNHEGHYDECSNMKLWGIILQLFQCKISAFDWIEL